MGTTLSTLITANLLLFLPLGASLSHLWEVIRPLQYLSMVALVLIIWPGNLHNFFFHMVDISSLDIFYGVQITEAIFSFRETEPFAPHFNEFGADSMNYLLNSSSIILPVVPMIIVECLLLAMLYKCSIKYPNNRSCRKIGMFVTRN
jgi:hypothetical protein